MNWTGLLEEAMPKTFPEGLVERAIEGAAREVLETMFFTMVEEEAPEAGGGGEFCSAVAFSGSFAGRLEVGLPGESAREIARDFLGLEPDEEPTLEQVGSTAGELVNMICGTTLSHLDSEGVFDLRTPERIAELSAGGGAIRAELPLEHGILGVRFSTQ